MAQQQTSSVVAAEVARFDALAAQWWDSRGPMRALHAMNPLRVGWVSRHAPRGRLLDIGCGAGLAAEALAREGFDVLGVDAAGDAIEAARAHAAGQGLPLSYRAGTAEQLLAEGARFGAITALEVIEHVADPPAFLRMLAALLEPGGVVVLSTLNRTARSFVVAKLGAEYVLRLLPTGTHRWRQFITPAELAGYGRAAGLRTVAVSGMVLDPFGGGWRESRDTGVNYIAALTRS